MRGRASNYSLDVRHPHLALRSGRSSGISLQKRQRPAPVKEAGRDTRKRVTKPYRQPDL